MARGSGKRLQPTVLQGVIDHIAAGERNFEVAKATGVHRDTIAKIRLSLEFWGAPYPPRCVWLGRPPALRDSHLAALKEYLLGRPQAYMDEMRNWQYDELD